MLQGLKETILKGLGERADFGVSGSHLKLANTFLKDYSLSEILPYVSFDPTTQLFINQNSLGFIIETLPLVGCGEEVSRQLTGLFQHSLPLSSNLQCLLIASPRVEYWIGAWENERGKGPRTAQELALERGQYFRSLATGHKKVGVRTFRLILSYSEGESVISPEALNRIQSFREQLSTTLKGWGLPVKVWQAENLLQGLDELLNPSDRLNTPQLSWNIHENLSDQLISPGARLRVAPFQLIYGGEEGNEEKLMRLYTARVFPNLWNPAAMGLLIGDPYDDFLRLNCPFFIHYGVHIAGEKTLKTKMLAKCGNVEKQAASPVAKYVPSLKREAEEWGYVREKFEAGQRLVRTRFQVGLLCDKGKLSSEEQTLFNLFRSHRWELVCDKYIQLPSLISCLPLSWGEGSHEDGKKFLKTKTTLSHEPANLIPLQGEWQGTSIPGMMLVGRRGQIFYWHPFDNNAGNYNTCVVGRSGSGKSVFMQEMMTSLLGSGGKVFVLDVGRSFEKTAKLLGGTFLEFSTHPLRGNSPLRGSSPICINPFSTIPIEDKEAASDALAMLKPILSLMAAPKLGTNDLETSYLEQSLHKAWEEKGIETTISDVAQALCDHKDRTAKSLGERLYPYTKKGTYGRFFEGPANIDLSASLVVVELEELKEKRDLQAVVVQMVILQITNSVYLGDRKTPSCLILDEAWDMLRGKQSGEFIETAARRLRKYHGGLVVGTQSINDFYATPGAQAAFDNADWMCLLSQKPESIEQLKKSGRLSIDANLERTLRSLHTEQGQYAEIAIIGPQGHAVGRLLLDPFSKILYSTKADEFAAVQRLQAEGHSLRDSIHIVSGVKAHG